MTDDADLAKMELQIADVQKTLGSVKKMCNAGNRVVFDEAGSYIEHKASGKRTPIKDEGNGYYVSLWMEKTTEATESPDFPGQA